MIRRPRAGSCIRSLLCFRATMRHDCDRRRVGFQNCTFMNWAAAIVLSACFFSVALGQVTGTAKSPTLRQQQGVAQLQGGHLQDALSEFRAAVAENPNDGVSHDYIGVILGESGKLNEAITEFEQAARFEPGLPDPHFHLGLAYEQANRTSQAISEYHEALRLNPALLEAQYGLSAICARLGDLDGAIHLLREVIKAAPSFAEAHYNLGLNLWNKYKRSMGLRQKSDLDQALEELGTASQLAPKQPRIYFALGQILADRGNLAPAVENLQKAVELDPPNPEYHYNLGLALRITGDMGPAGAEFREALKLNPNHALAHRSLGLVLREAGDFPAAASELRFAVAERIKSCCKSNRHFGSTLFSSIRAARRGFRRHYSCQEREPCDQSFRVVTLLRVWAY